ncbi:MAG: DUF4397 domain-containing protein [Clostridia bacterium]|nr:DUF4397 domain-containing protein [Clostridia bacterium]
MESRNIPVTPLPNPGEGGAVFPGDDGGAVQPVIPLPNPGEGGAVNPSSIVIQPLPGATITVPTRYAAVRFLNATHGYPSFRIFVDGTLVVNLLSAGTASGYVRIPAGSRVITVAGQDGYIYLEQALSFTSGSTSTVAIINRAGGLALSQIADACRVI